MRDTINQLFRKHLQALASTRKLTQIGAVTTITTGTWKDLGLTLSFHLFICLIYFIFFHTLVSSLSTAQSK